MKSECVHCGATDGVTDDHVPPANLFGKPKPHNLVTVPSCKSCNNGASNDDEYFRMMVAFRHDVSDHPEAKKIVPKVVRSLGRNQARGFQRAFAESISLEDGSTESGIYLGKQAVYQVDLQRLGRVVARTTSGLFFHHFGYRLPSNYEVKAYAIEGLGPIDSAIREQLLRISRSVLNNPMIIIGEGTFAYAFAKTSSDPNSSAWLLSFFERVIFLAMTTLRRSEDARCLPIA